MTRICNHSFLAAAPLPLSLRVMKWVVICIVALGALLLLALSMVDFITPREMTMTAIGETFYRIHLYAKANNELPTSFDQLPRRENHANRTTDGWGNELIYLIDDSGTVTIRSLGADAKPSGNDDDADLFRTYKWLDDNGKFIAGDRLWIVTDELQ